ncbi:MAG: methionyl-tRNA formyltransferase [Ignavibacteriaceae bacterium]|nr:methionyl-tRNA formyltransferase [Ignavibacteriaceae bacterium]
MKIVFFATPDFAIPSLNALIDAGHEITGVVTTPDKEQGRGRKLESSPVKKFAVEKGFHVITPLSLRDEKFHHELKTLGADLFVVVAFKILPGDVFTIPRYGSFNLHGSLLPKYRGAAPIQWALINGDTLTGLTTFALADKVDTGNIYLKKEVEILPEDNFETLHDRMSEIGAGLVTDTVKLIESGNFKLMPQDDSQASPAPKITKEISMISWSKSPVEIHNLIRGLSPFPGAQFILDGKVTKIYKGNPHDKIYPEGEFVINGNRAFIGCRGGSYEILELKMEGKKQLGIEEFLRGYRG